jgi:hypothetical protein
VFRDSTEHEEAAYILRRNYRVLRSMADRATQAAGSVSVLTECAAAANEDAVVRTNKFNHGAFAGKLRAALQESSTGTDNEHSPRA